MISVEEHLQRVLDTVGPLPPVELALADAHGCMLTEDVTAAAPLPGFDNSAMDGYAVRAGDVASASDASPVRLAVSGEVAAGAAADVPVRPGQCLRIMTGAPLPEGADAVVPVEATDGGTVTVTIRQSARPGAHVRRAGEDVPAGTVVLRAGTHIGAAAVGMLAAVGRRRVRCRPHPRVVVLSTGSELVEPGTPLAPGQLVDSNGYALTAAAREAGATPYRVGIVPDDERRLTMALEEQLVRADVVVTSGGVSVGAYDVVKQVAGRLGAVRFDRVAMQPGMPQAFGTIGAEGTPFFGLPGNPVSALVAFEVFVRPAIRRLGGAQPEQRPRVRATITERLTSPAGKRTFARARLAGRDGAYVVTPVGGSGSHLLSGMVAANALAVVPEEATEVPAGATVTVLMLERRTG